MKTLTLFVTMITAILFSTSCIGPQGVPGIDGRDGVDGVDGISDVNVAIYDVEPDAWSGDENGFITTLEVPEINQNIYLNGAVLVYILRNEGTADQSFNQLPYTWLNGSMTEYMDFDAYLGSIDILIRWVDNGVNTTEAPTGLYSFKIILIEGTPLSVLQENFDLSDPDALIGNFSNVTIF